MTDNLRVLRRDQPVNSRTRITRTQFHQHWDRMHNVAERGRFDQQDARELGGLQVRGRGPCLISVAVQSADDNQFGEDVQIEDHSVAAASTRVRAVKRRDRMERVRR